MLNTASEAEAMLNDYSSVWSHTIESGGAIPVEEHFIINSMGNIPDDFSTNIHSLNDYFEATGDLDDIRNSKDNIKNKITELNEPPKDFEKAYDEALNMYNYFMEYVDMALSPRDRKSTRLNSSHVAT